MSRISPRVEQIKPSATIMVTMKSMELKAQGKDIVSLGFGEPDFDTPEHIREAAIQAIRAGKTRYTQVDGTPELKSAIISKFRRDNNLVFTADQILVSNGAKQSLYNLLVAILNRNDEVIVPAGTLIPVPDHMRIKYVRIGLIADDAIDATADWTVDRLKEELKKLKLPVSGKKTELLKRLQAAQGE